MLRRSSSSLADMLHNSWQVRRSFKCSMAACQAEVNVLAAYWPDPTPPATCDTISAQILW